MSRNRILVYTEKHSSPNKTQQKVIYVRFYPIYHK